MSSKDRQFIPFAEFEPDSIEFDNAKLDVAENVTPSYGAYRPIEMVQALASLSGTDPLTGGYAHLTGSPSNVINLFATGEGPEPMVENWYVKDLVLITEADDYGIDQITGPGINDTTYILTPPLLDASAAELSYQFPETPREPAAVTGNVKFKIRFNVQNDARGHHQHRIDYEILEDGASLDTPLAGTWQTSGGDETFEDFEVDLTATNITDITNNGNWDKLSIHMLAECDVIASDVPLNEVPAADEYYDIGWSNESGETSDMYLSVNNLDDGYPGVPDYTTYVDSGVIPPGGESTIIFRYDEMPLPSDPEDHGHQFMGWFTASKSNTSIKMRVLQSDAPTDDDDPEDFWTFSGQQFRVLYEKEANNVSIDQSTPTVTEILDTPDDGYDWAQNADPTKFVYVAFTAEYAGDGGGGDTTVYMVPDGGTSPGWGGSISDIDNVSTGNESDATDAGISKTQNDDVPRSITFTLSDGPYRSSESDHVLHVKMQGPSTEYFFELLEGSTVRMSTGWRSGLDVDPGWLSKTLSAAEARAITDYNNLKARVYAASDDGTYKINEVYFEYPGDSSSARVYETYIVAENGASIGISDLRMEVTDPKNTNMGDLNETYVGTDTHLYEVTELGFTQTTRTASNYGLLADDVPKLWDFTSWGDDVIATNYSDVVQRKVQGTGNFVDLITGPRIPQARFCAVVGGSLVLADINPTSYSDGKPYHLWCSFLLDPTQFDLADYDNQSAIFPLVSKPGAITGLVGGEYGWVFKRNSIWQMRYVGLPPIFQFDLIAEGVGCSHPQSIVSAGGDVYFWGGGSINRVGPQGYERLSGLRVEKYLFDTGYEERGLYNRYGNDSRENDALVWGAYDAYSGLIWWLYRTLDDDQYSIDNIVIYSVVEDRFTTMRDTDLNLTLLLGQQNVVSNVPVMNRSILGFQKTATTTEYVKFQGDTTYTGTLKTKIITPSTWGYPVGRDADLTAVRPMYTSQPATDDNYKPTELPDFKITVTAAQDPALRIGVETQTVRRVREDRQGWLPLNPMVGEFWQFEVEFPELNRSTIKEFLGLQLLTNERGDG